MKDKIFSGVIAFLIITSIGQYFFYKNKISFLSNKNSELEQKQKEDIKHVRDSSIAKIKELTSRTRILDSIIDLPPKFKWKKYEKTIFIDRTLDDAIRVHTKHKAYREAEKTN